MHKSKTVVLCAVILALMAVMGALPYVFLLPLLFVCVWSNWKMSLAASLMFGVVSLCYAFMGSSIVSVAFVSAPWIPIVPRLFVGLGAHFAYKGADKLIRGGGKLRQSLPYAVAGAAGSLLNTGLIIACLVLFTPDVVAGGTVMYVYAPYLLISGAIELAVNALLLPPIAVTVKKALSRGGARTKPVEVKEES